ncbi:MAG: FkbM family methyltransferase [Chroococcidiopsidaceae cyanobacterium CP_BM_ER_R8_30]|nr:FkbM family methyltransferase [Chroococcidiopsidaceae cyanobacterium CP_BM_ER_R8_30]
MRSMLRGILQSVCHLYPLYSGCGTIANTPLFRRMSYSTKPLVKARLRDGQFIFVRLDDFIGRAVFYFGDLDPKVTLVCKRLLRSGDTMLDVGANCGLITMYAAKIVGSSGRVHAFEPQPALAELIRESANANGYNQVLVHNIALSVEDGVLDLFVPSDNGGAASFSQQWGQICGADKTIQVEVRRTADYLASLNLKRVRLMKIDVEGHEEFVLRGGLDFFRDHGPDAIVFESSEHAGPFWEREPVKLLTSINYTIFAIKKSKFGSLRLQELNRQTDGQVSGHDFIAIKRGEQYEDILSALQVKTA